MSAINNYYQQNRALGLLHYAAQWDAMLARQTNEPTTRCKLKENGFCSQFNDVGTETEPELSERRESEVGNACM